MQVVIIVFIGILVVSFITGLVITFFEKKVKVKDNHVIDDNNSKNVDATTVVNPVGSVESDYKDNNKYIEKNCNNFVSDVELLEETMVLDVPEIIKVLNDDEDIETI